MSPWLFFWDWEVEQVPGLPCKLLEHELTAHAGPAEPLTLLGNGQSPVCKCSHGCRLGAQPPGRDHLLSGQSESCGSGHSGEGTLRP